MELISRFHKMYEVGQISLSNYAEYAINNLNMEIYEYVKKHSSDAIVIINSASPDILVKEITKILGFDEGIGSTLEYLNLGMNKWNNANFQKYVRRLEAWVAISDNTDDLPWMKNFSMRIFLEN